MSALLRAVWGMSLAGSAAACAAMVLRLLFNRVSPRFSCALWLVVFFLLACPLRPESPLALLPRDTIALPAAVTAVLPQTDAAPLPLPQPSGAGIVPTGAGPLDALAPLWLCGAAALLLYAAVRYWQLRRRVYDATRVDGNVFESDKLPTALVLGFFRPRIYLPAAVADRALLLRHERAHIRRRDHLLKPLLFGILALHWFNPVVWASYCLMARDMELACDEAALRGEGPEVRRAYALLLLRLCAGRPGLWTPPAFGGGSKNAVKGRIVNVLHVKNPPCWAAVLCSLFIILFAAGFTTAPPREDGATPPPPAVVQQDGGGWAQARPSRGYVSRRDSLIQAFAPLAPYGVVYDPDRDAAFYQGVQIKLMVIFQSSPEPGGYAFDLCYRSDADSTLYLEGVRDSGGALTGVRPLDPEIAADLLDDGASEAAPSAVWAPEELEELSELPQGTGALPAGSVRYVVMDGTQVLEPWGITAHDPTWERADESVRAWMARCDRQTGAYALRVTGEGNDVIYLYYNGGGRYPWLLSADGARIDVELVEDSGLATADGYCLLSITAPKSFTDLHLFLGGRELALA